MWRHSTNGSELPPRPGTHLARSRHRTLDPRQAPWHRRGRALQHVESGYALELLGDDAAGIGYLLKDRVSHVEDFVEAVRRVAGGGSALDPEVVSLLVGRHRGGGALDDLTAREREVLQLVAEGRSNQGIAKRLVVTERAIEKHVTSIFQKLHLPPAADDHRRVLATLAHLRA